MRKLGLLLILFLVVGAFAFAADMTVEERVAALESNSAIVPSISGDATLTIGYDLQNGHAGFKNAMSSDVAITWYDDVSTSKDGEGWYGHIELNDYTLKETAGAFSFTAPTVVAKITNGSIYATVYGAPAADIEDVAGVDVVGTITGAASPAYPAFAASNTVYGTTIGYGSGIVSDVSLGVVSDGDWTANTNNDFGVRINADLVPMDLLEVKAHFLYGMMGNATIGFGIQPIITVSSIMSGLTTTIGFEGAMPNGGSLAWEASVGVVQNLAAENSDGNTDNVALKLIYNSGSQMDVSLMANLYDNAGFIPNTGIVAGVSLVDLTGTLAWGLTVGGDYNSGGLKPYFYFTTDSLSVNQVNVGVELGSDLTSIDNTTITLDYVTTDLATNTGVVTLATKVAF